MRCFRPAAVVLALTLAPAALAASGGNGFGSFGLVDGKPPFQGCLNGEQCSDKFFKFFNQAALEQGFSMQGGAPLGSSVVNQHSGWSVGGMLHTFPLGPPRKNLSGKTENTQFSPVLPKLAAARSWDADKTHWGVGMTMLPPVPVQGAAALILGLQASMAKDTEGGRMGVEADFSFVRAQAPVAASKDQMTDADQFSEGHLEEEVYAANCDADTGCIDTFTVANLELLWRMGWSAGEHWVPHVGLGLTVVNERLHIQYDDTTWSVFGLQPALHGGAAWTPTDSVFLSTGASAALRQANQSPDGAGVFYRLEGSAAYRF